MHHGQKGPSTSCSVEKVAVWSQPFPRPQHTHLSAVARMDPVATGSG